MTKKQKKTLKRILAALVLTVLLAVVFHFTALRGLCSWRCAGALFHHRP